MSWLAGPQRTSLEPSKYSPLTGNTEPWEHIAVNRARERESADHREDAKEDYELEIIHNRNLTSSSTSNFEQSLLHDSSSKTSWRQTWKRRYFSGWTVGVATASLTATTVCLINLIGTVVGASLYKPSGGIAALYEGSCTQTTRLSFWIHMVINVLSTLLLSGSNYTMQVLASPTRDEVDRAHVQHQWMDIGVPSVRNLWRISRLRLVLWVLLAASSVPLHLLYNTAVFSSISANSYDVYVVTEDFLMASDYSTNSTNMQYEDTHTLTSLQKLSRTGELEKLQPDECASTYNPLYISRYSNVLAVTTAPAINSVIDSLGSQPAMPEGERFQTDAPNWMCRISRISGSCMYNRNASTESGWYVDSWDGSPERYPLAYCMVQQTPEHCQLNFSVAIMAIVTCVNAIKAAAMLITVLRVRTPTLVTVGDAVASFLEKPDATTANMSLAGKEDIQKRWNRGQVPLECTLRQERWFRAASLKRWISCNLLCGIVIITGGVLLHQGMKTLARVGNAVSLPALWKLGFGTIDLDATVTFPGTGKLLTATFLANVPQTILSFLYLSYNSLYSCMLGAAEWSSYAHTRKSLRVTSPAGKQRSTYFLSVPYKYGIPLMVLSGSLHWFLSQSLFLIAITPFDEDGKRVDSEDAYYEYGSDSGYVTSVGYSCIGIVFALIVGVLAVIVGGLMGMRKYLPGIPLAGSCSAAISAACHLPEHEEASLKLLMWGEVDPPMLGDEDRVGHCAFSPGTVQMPVAGRMYT